jgi:hypothetical protein
MTNVWAADFASKAALISKVNDILECIKWTEFNRYRLHEMQQLVHRRHFCHVMLHLITTADLFIELGPDYHRNWYSVYTSLVLSWETPRHPGSLRSNLLRFVCIRVYSSNVNILWRAIDRSKSA